MIKTTQPSRTGTRLTDTDRAIDALQPGSSVRISGDDRCWMTVERSGDGKQLRYVRHTLNHSSVFHRTRF